MTAGGSGVDGRFKSDLGEYGMRAHGCLCGGGLEWKRRKYTELGTRRETQSQADDAEERGRGEHENEPRKEKRYSKGSSVCEVRVRK